MKSELPRKTSKAPHLRVGLKNVSRRDFAAAVKKLPLGLRPSGLLFQLKE